MAQPISGSKGCGGVMRTAPLGFLGNAVSDADLVRLGAEAAALTNGHPDGFLPAGAIAAAGEATALAPSREQVAALGEGWVGEEALAVGLYAAATTGSFAECVELAANHDGDSGSTASIAGQLYGARQWLNALPAEAVYRLDVLEAMLEVAGEWGQVEKR